MIAVRQLNGTELAQFINNTVSGENFSGFLQAYTNVSGYLGDTVMYGTGGNQTVYTVFAFQACPTIPYSGADTGSAASQKWAYDQINSFVGSLSGSLTGDYVSSKDKNQTILGYKVFTGAVGVGTPISNNDATPLSYITYISGLLQTGLNNVVVPNVVTTDGTQIISGEKDFTISPRVPTPADQDSAVPLWYITGLSITTAVQVTGGDQTVSGIKTFVQSPLIPLGTDPAAAVNRQQLDALGVSMGNITGFAGVLSINGSTGGASGNVYLQGAGTVSVLQCGAIFYVSGVTPNLTQFYSAQIPLPSGTTGLSFLFPTDSGSVLLYSPTITDALVVTSGNGGFFGHYVYGVSTEGFSVAFQSGIPSDSYSYHFNAVPQTGASGFFGLQGQDGRAGASLNPRGVWQPGVLYSNLDWVYQPTVYASYACVQTHASSSFNAPGGTGNGFWNILSSGTPGPTGSWIYRGNYNTGTTYSANQSASLSGSTYGFTGVSPVTNLSPFPETGGWVVVAKAGGIGYFVNSGIITGNFVNISFFADPVSTGLNIGEAFISRSFQYTGYALGCVTSGAKPDQGNFILTGQVYVRDFAANTRTVLQTFTLDTGIYNTFSGNFAFPITGMDRLGFDILSTLSGISKLSVGLFGFGLG